MSFYFRDKPRFSDKLRGKSGDELLQEIKQQFDEDSKSFFEPTTTRSSRERDPFERHSSFPRGFPFDDEGFGRRSDIRAHLDDLAARHPEFADQLLGPPWADIPFHGSLRNRRRGSGSGSNNYQGHPDEDARSQASGGSAASAASGASGVSSHGEPEINQRQQDSARDSRKNPIPNYGLRNTVDIGQHHHNMENPEKANRGQRSMSAPPENRQQPGQEQPQQGQRFVSRVDITPQYTQPTNQQQSPPPPPQQAQQQQKAQQQGNVRHIPIFVEGRDEPVLPKNVGDVPFKREPSPPQYRAQSPHFARSSPFGQSFGSRQHNWPPHFQETFYEPQTAFEQPMRRQQTTHGYHQQPKQQQYAERQRPESQQQYYEQPKQHQQKSQPQPQPQQQQQQAQEPPRPKPTLPKDPLERVALVQKEVDSLAEQVKQYTGNSRKDKDYMYLDEMLTRELIKLDDIETEGRENVRQARKNAIKTIQQTISLLESKAPLPYSQQQSVDESAVENEKSNNNCEGGEQQAMEVDQKEEEPSREPIPLPPGPSSPTKKIEESQEGAVPQSEEMKVDVPAAEQEATQTTTQTGEVQQAADPQAPGEPMDSAPADKTETNVAAEVQQPTDNLSNQEAPAESKKGEESETKKVETTSAKTTDTETVSESQAPTQTAQLKPEVGEEKMEVDAPVKSAKKARKTKKQTPVSEQPIPLPPPEAAEASAK